MIGLQLRHYRIESKIGEGGMGVVYRAFDDHLNRPVAIKILKPDMLGDSDRRKRFVQEAKSASALNHPNIITIYDIDTAEMDGECFEYIAMEYLAGRTLDDLIARKGLEWSEILRYAVQIADALAAAHGAGIIHRDIKPANIMVTDGGYVKLLDFGLAKLVERSGANPAGGVTQTIMAGPVTEHGTVIGTPAYMSPEQAKGYALDPRSDIFSFGAVLYEMATRHKAFEGESKLSIATAVVHREPKPPGEIVPSMPHELDRIILRCLRKDPEYRFQHMGDLKVALRELKEDSETGRLRAPSLIAVPARRTRARWLLTAVPLTLVLLAAMVFTSWRYLRARVPASKEPLLLTRLTSDSGLTTDPAISPDGKLLAYASDRSGEGNLSIWLRQVAGGDPVRLTSDPADNSEPCFSPDGTQIAFRSERDGGGIYVISSLGGEARLLAKHGNNPQYSPDGNWIAYWVGDRQASAQVYLVQATGGPPKALEFRPPLRQSRYPVWSPDGKYLIFSGRSQSNQPEKEQYDWWVASVDTQAVRRTGAFDTLARNGVLTSYALAPGQWTGDRILFSAGLRAPVQQGFAAGHVVNPNEAANLWQIQIAPGAWEIKGAPERLTFGTGMDSNFSMAASGHIVFSSLSENLDIWKLPLDASQGKVLGAPERLTQDASPDGYPSITRDGRLLVFWSERSGNADIWLKDFVRKRESRLTRDPAYKTYPMIAPDGSKVAYFSLQTGKPSEIELMSLDAEGRPGTARTVCQDCGNISDLSADGKVLSYNDPSGTVISLDSASGQKAALKKEQPYHLADPRFSPDARWIAFHGILSPVARQIFIAPAPGLPDAPWIPVTDGTGMERLATWSPDGNLLYFITERDGFRCIAARRLNPATKQPAGPVFVVHHFHSARLSMTKFANVNMSRFSIARRELVFTLGERTGNIWMTRLP